jgi:cytochrome c553
MVRAFKALGVDEAGMAEHLGRAGLADLDDEDVVKLREYYAARKAEAVEVEI